ncbi:UDP-glucose:undecaprenyl-phosphate glucose-1-phosphate transferase [candidate division SR1 bacterium Aalborg_AAW-1]|nr:UDP-glucose:undecaprenyl-phosphate glucose-1-phosphate transferase [candidate division SR1 bacterium Aalborg_AAW-1]
MKLKNKKFITIIRLLRPLLHFLVVLFIYRIAYILRSNTNIFWSIDIGTPWIATQELIRYAIISASIFIITGIVHKRYDLISLETGKTKTFLTVWWQWTIIVTCLAYFGQGFIFEHGISRLIVIITALLSLIVIPFIEIIWDGIYVRWIKRFSHTIHILLQDKPQQAIITQLTLPTYYNVRTSFFYETDIDAIHEDIIILVGSYTKDELQELIDLIRLKNKQVYHIGDNHFLEDVIYTHTKFAGIMALRYTSSQIEGWAAITKRIVDITGSLIGIIITSPILLITALAIKLDSKGPIFYRQERVGKNGEHFLFTKFRSMYTHLSVGSGYGGQEAEQLYKDLVNSHANIRKGELPKIKNDPRVTKVGKFIRATSIDELPNLFAVLKGDMSLIGPRPHLPNEIENYKPRQRRVLSIKPGITGYAQIHGRDTLTFDQEATKELEYIQNWSLWLDIYIIFATFGVLFGGRGK